MEEIRYEPGYIKIPARTVEIVSLVADDACISDNKDRAAGGEWMKLTLKLLGLEITQR